LSLWGIIEALLRRRAEEVSIPIERFPTVSLIKHIAILAGVVIFLPQPNPPLIKGRE
jgi:hypothetical protein